MCPSPEMGQRSFRSSSVEILPRNDWTAMIRPISLGIIANRTSIAPSLKTLKASERPDWHLMFSTKISLGTNVSENITSLSLKSRWYSPQSTSAIPFKAYSQQPLSCSLPFSPVLLAQWAAFNVICGTQSTDTGILYLLSIFWVI